MNRTTISRFALSAIAISLWAQQGFAQQNEQTQIVSANRFQQPVSSVMALTRLVEWLTLLPRAKRTERRWERAWVRWDIKIITVPRSKNWVKIPGLRWWAITLIRTVLMSRLATLMLIIRLSPTVMVI